LEVAREAAVAATIVKAVKLRRLFQRIKTNHNRNNNNKFLNKDYVSSLVVANLM